ncbi:hypothetical protein SALBM135S_06346 [Streptomyces alboniger]
MSTETLVRPTPAAARPRTVRSRSCGGPRTRRRETCSPGCIAMRLRPAGVGTGPAMTRAPEAVSTVYVAAVDGDLVAGRAEEAYEGNLQEAGLQVPQGDVERGDGAAGGPLAAGVADRLRHRVVRGGDVQGVAAEDGRGELLVDQGRGGRGRVGPAGARGVARADLGDDDRRGLPGEGAVRLGGVRGHLVGGDDGPFDADCVLHLDLPVSMVRGVEDPGVARLTGPHDHRFRTGPCGLLGLLGPRSPGSDRVTPPRRGKRRARAARPQRSGRTKAPAPAPTAPEFAVPRGRARGGVADPPEAHREPIPHRRHRSRICRHRSRIRRDRSGSAGLPGPLTGAAAAATWPPRRAAGCAWPQTGSRTARDPAGSAHRRIPPRRAAPPGPLRSSPQRRARRARPRQPCATPPRTSTPRRPRTPRRNPYDQQ